MAQTSEEWAWGLVESPFTLHVSPKQWPKQAKNGHKDWLKAPLSLHISPKQWPKEAKNAYKDWLKAFLLFTYSHSSDPNERRLSIWEGQKDQTFLFINQGLFEMLKLSPSVFGVAEDDKTPQLCLIIDSHKILFLTEDPWIEFSRLRGVWRCLNATF